MSKTKENTIVLNSFNHDSELNSDGKYPSGVREKILPYNPNNSISGKFDDEKDTIIELLRLSINDRTRSKATVQIVEKLFYQAMWLSELVAGAVFFNDSDKERLDNVYDTELENRYDEMLSSVKYIVNNHLDEMATVKPVSDNTIDSDEYSFLNRVDDFPTIMRIFLTTEVYGTKVEFNNIIAMITGDYCIPKSGVEISDIVYIKEYMYTISDRIGHLLDDGFSYFDEFLDSKLRY